MSHILESTQDGQKVVHADNTRLQAAISDYHHVVKDAATADKQQHDQSWRQAARQWWPAILWSMGLSAALIMEGYDVVVIGSFYAHPAFLDRFGVLNPASGLKVIPAEWQSALGNGSSAGGIIGLLVNGIVSERYGAKATMLTALVALTGFIFIFFFANSLGMLVAAEVLAGIPWGIFQTLTTAYASEVCPIQLRHYLTAYVNMCWGIGILISSGVVRSQVVKSGNLAWQLPFALQWIWILPLMIIVYFCPPSPWWLVRQGRYEDAQRSIMRLADNRHFSEEDAKRTVAMYIHTTELEKSTQAGTSYIDCFRGIDRRRTEIAMLVFAIQLGSGQNLVGQAVQFFVQAGISTLMTFNLNMVVSSMFVLGTIASWGLLTWFGRRTLYIGGLAAMNVSLLLVGILGFFPSNAQAWVSGAVLIVISFVYNSTLGPVCYTLIAEVGSTRLRAKTVVLSRIAYQIANIICGIIVPRMLSPTAWNWGPKSGIFWFGMNSLCIIWCVFRLPETRNRSFGELDVLFQNKVKAWRFAKTKVDQFDMADDQGAVTPPMDIKEDIQKLE